jgi:predicted 2-oxoglutarate/Fe(II)-dependent dioxygenase YbiX
MSIQLENDVLSKNVIGGVNITKYENFLTKEECEELIKFFDAAYEDWNQICFYQSFGMHVQEPLKKDHGTSIDKSYLENLKQKLIKYVSHAAGEPMKINSMHAQKWEVGAFARPHSDNSDLEGNDSGWKDNKWFSGVYLNENYDGGLLEFRDHDISLKLEAGTLLTFPGGMENIHSVSEVTSGTRYTICVFWDFEKTWYSEAELQEMEHMIAKERILQGKLKKRWKNLEVEPENNTYEGTIEWLGSEPYEVVEELGLTKDQLKSNARRNQENAIKEGRVPAGAVNDMILEEN